MRTARTRAIERRSYHRRRTRYLTQGLTAHGSPWRRSQTLPECAREEHYQKQNLAKYHRRTKRRAAEGLNSRGKPYKTLVMYRAWERLKTEMEAA